MTVPPISYACPAISTVARRPPTAPSSKTVMLATSGPTSGSSNSWRKKWAHEVPPIPAPTMAVREKDGRKLMWRFARGMLFQLTYSRRRLGQRRSFSVSDPDFPLLRVNVQLPSGHGEEQEEAQRGKRDPRHRGGGRTRAERCPCSWASSILSCLFCSDMPRKIDFDSCDNLDETFEASRLRH